jgi:signal transduction histidine kinase
VRGVIGEVRDTLYDLRTDVSDAVTLVDVLEDFAVRVTERCGLEVEVQADRRRRPALLQERELWRIAQEALMNVERHANATRARIVWRCDGDSALLEILDDGEGFPSGVAGRLDSYGILGMRERASSIGATLEVLTAPGKGTRVRCLLQQSEE